MDTSKRQPDVLAQYQQQTRELSAEIVRLKQENDRLIHDSAAPSQSVELKDNRIHQSRDRLLEAASAATNILLTLDNLDEAIDTALSILGEGAGCDRINVLENFYASQFTFPTYLTVIYEWAQPNIIPQMSHLEAGRIYTAGIETFLDRYYLHGDGFGGLLAEWDEPLRSALAAVGVKLKKSLDYLATETSLEKFLGQILNAIAEQFDSPLAEYWYHPDDTAYIGMMSWHGRTYNRAEILQQYPDRSGVDGFPIPPEMMSIGDLPPHKQYFITEDWLTDPNFKHIKWLPPDNLYKQINVPLVLGSKCIGAEGVTSAPETCSLTGLAATE